MQKMRCDSLRLQPTGWAPHALHAMPPAAAAAWPQHGDKVRTFILGCWHAPQSRSLESGAIGIGWGFGLDWPLGVKEFAVCLEVESRSSVLISHMSMDVTGSFRALIIHLSVCHSGGGASGATGHLLLLLLLLLPASAAAAAAAAAAESTPRALDRCANTHVLLQLPSKSSAPESVNIATHHQICRGAEIPQACPSCGRRGHGRTYA